MHLSTSRIVALTVGFAGLQPIFSLIFSSGSTFLRHVGLNDGSIALVWLGGPFCGSVVQPYIGLYSEQYQSAWGRRRPYLIGCTIGAATFLLSFAYIDRYATMQSHERKPPTIFVLGASFCFISLNLFTQLLQSGLQALIIDFSPSSQVALTNAWASRMINLGNVASYIVGLLDLTSLSSTLYISQFGLLCIVYSVNLIITISVCCVSITEVTTQPTYAKSKGIMLLGKIPTQSKMLYRSFNLIPHEVRQVCYVQFFSWIAWAPFFYYIATYVAFVYHAGPSKRDMQNNMPTESSNATHAGTIGLLFFAIAALSTTILLPILLLNKQTSYHQTRYVTGTDITWYMKRMKERKQLNRRLQLCWMCSHLLYALSMLSTAFVTSLHGTLVLVTTCGISWGISNYVPLTLIANSIGAFADSYSDGWGITVRTLDPETGPGTIMALQQAAISVSQMISALTCSLIFYRSHTNHDHHKGSSSVLDALQITALSAILASILIRNQIL